MQAMSDTQAVLSSNGGYTIFMYGGNIIRFRTSDNLERYTAVKHWDNGYLVVNAKYRTIPDEIEEYIDLEYILDSLNTDSSKELAPIKQVRIEYV